MYWLSFDLVAHYVHRVGLTRFMEILMKRLESDYRRWDSFGKSARHASYFGDAAIELMPIYDQTYYVYKLISTYANNPKQGLLTVMGIGMVADVRTGCPLLAAEMALLTAIRTACMSAWIAPYCLVPGKAINVGVIGLGAQAIFQVIALSRVYKIDCIYAYDINPQAAKRFEQHIKAYGLLCHICDAVKPVCDAAQLLVTATNGSQVPLFEAHWIKPGCHIIAMGGDAPGRTELPVALLRQARIIVEYIPQTKVEGEIQQLNEAEQAKRVISIDALLKNKALIEQSDLPYTIFDSVGFALSDYSVLVYMLDLLKQEQVQQDHHFLPDQDDLFHLFLQSKPKS